MSLFFTGVFLLLECNCIFQVDGGVQRYQVDATRYNERYRVNLKLGDCPTREITYPNGTTRLFKCPYKYTGDPYFIPLAETSFDVKRVKTNTDVTSKIGGAITIGAGVAGLISAEIKGSVTVDMQASRKLLTLSSVYRMQRGIMTLRNAKPAGPLPAYYQTELYLSEIVLGGTETLIVNMEFSSEKSKTEVELTITVKILWISLSAKLTFISESLNQSAVVEVIWSSTWRGLHINRFEGVRSFQKAIKLVKKYEKQIENGPANLLRFPLHDKRLHLEYYFSSWDRGIKETKFNEALAIAHLEGLILQIQELWNLRDKIDAYLNYAKWSFRISRENVSKLSRYQFFIDKKLDELFLAYRSYLFMTPRERSRIPYIYGRSSPPYYYTRQLNRIFRPGDEFTYLKEVKHNRRM